MRTVIVLGAAVLFTAVSIPIYTEEPARIVAIGDIAPGHTVSIRGEVVRLADYDEIIVEDASGRVEVFAPDGFRRTAFDVGDVITVTGRVDDDRIALRREIHADTIILADGSRYIINDPIFDYCDEGIE
ncbi:MAG: hypothetical protein MI724_11240 [Spirochaetales bacterium]|nr:hypothetical protein [Spirochaetales bacterium]